VLKIVYLMNYQ